MITLSRIVLVNWYTFGAQDIDIRGSVGIVGPNGAGKSSILDAIQVVITGNNNNHLALNASSNQDGSGRKTNDKRSVRDYCLGKIQNVTLRPTSITYLALVFEREHDKRCWTIGMGLSAREQDQSEELLCAFIAPNQSLRSSDFLVENEVGRFPIDHTDLLVKLRRTPNFENYGHRPANFTKHVLTTLRGKNFQADPKRFLTSLKRALRFSEMESANQFVRTFLLDDDKVDIETLRESVATWRNFQQKIEELEAQKEAVSRSIKTYRSIIELQEEAERMRWVEAYAEKLRLEDHLARLTKQFETKQGEHHRAQTLLTSTRARLEQAKDELGDIKRSLATDNRELAIRKLQIDLERITSQLADNERKRDSYLADLALAISISDSLIQTFDDGQYNAARSACKSLAERVKADKQVSPQDIDAAVQRTGQPLQAYRDVLNERYASRGREQTNMLADLRSTQDQLRTIMAGGALVQRQTQSLIDHLAARGIEAQPIATFIEVLDEEWREAVEMQLGEAREALIVDPEHAHAASTFVRENKHQFRGCRIVNTTKTSEIDPIPKVDSLAAILSTDNAHVRAYINRLLNNVIRVQSVDELLKVNRGITPDCMLASGGAIQVGRPRDKHLLGKDAIIQNRPFLEARISEFELDLDRAKTEIAKYASLLSRIDKFLAATSQSEGLFALDLAVRDASQSQLSTQDNIRDLQEKRDPSIRQRMQDLETDIDDFREQEADDERNLRVVQRELDLLEHQLSNPDNGVTKQSEEAGAAFAEIDLISQNERDVNLREYRALRSEFKEAPAIRNKARSEAARAEGDAKRHEGAAPEQAFHYAQQFEVPGWDKAFTHHQALEWLEASRDAVENNHLTQYREQVETARIAMEDALRSDLLLKLYDRIQNARGQINALSRHLKTKKFHEEHYEFSVNANPAYNDIIQVARQIRENPSDVSNLFTVGADLEGEIARGVSRIRKLLESGEDISEISDYRNYLQFELVTRDKNGQVVSKYSERKGTGSGGEKQVPFYLAISSAVSSTCHHQEAQRKNLGLGFVIFDEAFNKLDGANTNSCLALMNEFNLQTIVSAPVEKQVAFNEHMQTMVFVNRIGTVCQIDVEYPTEAGREMFRQANPANEPIDLFIERKRADIADAAE